MKEDNNDLLETYPFLESRPSADLHAFNCPLDKLVEFLRAMRDEERFDFLADITGIDHGETEPRFEVVYHLFSTERHFYLRVVAPCEGFEEPLAPSVTSLWPAADWHEREAFDMFGIRFEGHPDLRRILMWDGYPYYPLRREFPLAGEEVDLPSADVAEATNTKVLPAPMMGGPFHSPQSGPISRREPRADDESWTEVRFRQIEEKFSPGHPPTRS